MSVDTINKNLRAMRAAGKVMDIKAKGAAGEAAAFDIVHEYRTKRGGILKQGFMYPYASNRQGQVYLGNIFWDEEKQKFYDMTKQLYDVLPFGDPRYIVPVVCFVDESTIDEQRSDKMRYYLPMTILDNLKQLLIDRDLPVDADSGYTLDLDMIEKKLKSIERERDL